MTRRLAVRMVVALALAGVLSGCLDEVETFFAVARYAESDDPDQRAIGNAIVMIDEEERTQEALDMYVETRDRRWLDEAFAIRPTDRNVLAMRIVAGILDGDDRARRLAEGDLKFEVAQDRRAELARRTSGPVELDGGDRNLIDRQTQENVFALQEDVLFGEVDPFERQVPDLNDDGTARLFEDYCRNRADLTDEASDVRPVQNPPCP